MLVKASIQYASLGNRCGYTDFDGLYIKLCHLKQVENEYGTYEEEYGEAGRSYASWAAEMALRQNTGVPWIMCKQWDVPTAVVSFLSSFTTAYVSSCCQSVIL